MFQIRALRDAQDAHFFGGDPMELPGQEPQADVGQPSPQGPSRLQLGLPCLGELASPRLKPAPEGGVVLPLHHQDGEAGEAAGSVAVGDPLSQEVEAGGEGGDGGGRVWVLADGRGGTGMWRAGSKGTAGAAVSVAVDSRADVFLVHGGNVPVTFVWVGIGNGVQNPSKTLGRVKAREVKVRVRKGSLSSTAFATIVLAF
mmetsp:Transcript_23527/g.53686  ORF Transcript_23527/g.53686 Transcript_23527/m.53686 type:complete len:200 (+) Transcript_23527:1793-2392(+)